MNTENSSPSGQTLYKFNVEILSVNQNYPNVAKYVSQNILASVT